MINVRAKQDKNSVTEVEKKETNSGNDIKIGELLLAVGVVTNGDLQEAIQIAKRMNLPIGRVIVMSGVISETNLQQAVEAQSLIRDGLLDIDTAVLALKNSYANKQTLQEALTDLAWAPKQDATSNKLGELLIDSNIVTQAQLDSALHTSFDTGMPLGGTLVLQGVLSAQLLPMVLNAQEKIREGKITRNEAVENLKAAVIFWAKAEDNKDFHSDLATSGSAKYHLQETLKPSLEMGLVEMMKLSGYCTDKEIRIAVEKALSNSDIAAKLFMATGLLNQNTLDNFIQCRTLMLNGTLKPEQVIYALSAYRAKQVSLSEILTEMQIKV